jgi:hypothetical protein
MARVRIRSTGILRSGTGAANLNPLSQFYQK